MRRPDMRLDDNKIYLSRAQSRAWASEYPVGDPTGGAAYGERRDPVTAAVAGGSALLGYMGSQSQAGATRDAANTSAAAQLEAARLAAEEARFRPVGVTTRFGQSNFTTDANGRVSGAGYTLSPELKAYQDRIMGLTGQGLTEAEAAQGRYAPLTGAASGLFNLGAGYLAQSPEQAAAQYMQRQQDLLAPSRERQYAGLQNTLFNTGRGGLAVGATGARPGGGAGLGAANPEMEAYYNAIAQQDATLASNAMEQGQRQTAFGAGLFGEGAGLLNQYTGGLSGAYAPFTAGLGTAQTIESLGQAPLDIGVSIGGRNVNQTGANALFQGGVSAARTAQGPAGYSPSAGLFSGLSNYAAQGVPSLTSLYNQYQQGQQLSNQYGAGNVYGMGGAGTQPTYDYGAEFGY
jgi:hypothetical protein